MAVSGISSARPSTPHGSRTRVTHEIINQLLDEITSGERAPESRLPNERDLASRFGVSQPTVREAVRALDAMGLIEVRHGSGVYVTGDSTHLVGMALRTLLQLEKVDILDILDIRMNLGAYSARRAVAEATDEDIATLEAILASLEDIESATTVTEVAERAMNFQIAFSAASHHALLYALEKFLIELLTQVGLARKKRGLAALRKWTLGFASNRREIVDALKARDEQATVEAMSVYLTALHDAFADAKPAPRSRATAAGNGRPSK